MAAAGLPPWLTYFVVGLAALVVLPWDIRVQPGPIPWTKRTTEGTGELDEPQYVRELREFPCSGLRCAAWLYLPKGAKEPPPVVVMAHGMGGQRDMGLHRYADAFAKAGLACFVFDYRGFGGSEGKHRNWVSPSRHVADWLAAIAYVRSGALGERVDASRLALWGTSFAGGHVLVAAAQTPGIKAIVSQVPHLDGVLASRMSITKRGVLQTLRMLVAGLHDKLRTAVGLPAAYLPLVGPPGSMAFMQLDPDEQREYFAKHPKVYQGDWRNLARASLVLEMSRYSPIQHLPQVEAPILFVAATNDSLCSFDAVERAVAAARDASLLARDCNHFELYRGGLFEGVIGEEAAFLIRHTLLPAAAGEAGSAGSVS